MFVPVDGADDGTVVDCLPRLLGPPGPGMVARQNPPAAAAGPGVVGENNPNPAPQKIPHGNAAAIGTAFTFLCVWTVALVGSSLYIFGKSIVTDEVSYDVHSVTICSLDFIQALPYKFTFTLSHSGLKIA
jgi:hypothetical protein